MMLVRTICLVAAIYVGHASAQICQQVLTQLTWEYLFSGTSTRSNKHMQLIQHGTPFNRKCNFLRERGINTIEYQCINTTGMCQDVRGQSMEQIIVILKSYESYKDTSAGTANPTKLFRPGLTLLKHKFIPKTDFSCNPYSQYRSLDGSCNNLINTNYGMQGTAQRRIITNAYDDGKNAPKTRSKCPGVSRLPSPRTVSNLVHIADRNTDLDNVRTLFVMQVGQFLAHDVVLTHVETRSNGTALDCCGVDKNSPLCFPIPIPPGDPIFTDCMDFPRSKGVFHDGVREQINSQTAFVDLSLVYGVSVEESNNLRTLANDGKLKNVLMNRKLVKDPDDNLCHPSMPTDAINYYCPLAGDVRVNEQPGLASIHTIFMREHNRLAEALRKVNPGWSGERLFQEARKINIGQWQHIVFNEYLPAILGPLAMVNYNLWVNPKDYRDTYSNLVDPSVVNSAAAAVLRFGHTLVPNVIRMADLSTGGLFHTDELKNNYFEPKLYHSFSNTGMDSILKWMSSSACPLSDRKLEDSIRQFLFFDGMSSLDLASLNIQRGRDHGLPGYNWYRKFVCGLSRALHFGTGQWGLVDHEADVAWRLSQAYACPDDIDLFTGFLSERRLPGSVFGPTGQCILGLQFQRIRDGDRFFYERFDQYAGGFTKPQLLAIKRIKMSDLFCLNTLNVQGKKVQRNIFFQPSFANPVVDCSTLQGVHIKLWRE